MRSAAQAISVALVAQLGSEKLKLERHVKMLEDDVIRAQLITENLSKERDVLQANEAEHAIAVVVYNATRRELRYAKLQRVQKVH